MPVVEVIGWRARLGTNIYTSTDLSLHRRGLKRPIPHEANDCARGFRPQVAKAVMPEGQ